MRKKRNGEPSAAPAPRGGLGKFVTYADYERLKTLFRTACVFRDVCDDLDGRGYASAQLLEKFPKEWSSFRAALLDVELCATAAKLRDES